MITAVEASVDPGARRLPRWRRWLAHVLATPLTVRRAFPRAALRSVGAAIELAEAGHTGEIVFVVEGSPPWSYVWRNATVRRRALALFAELRVWDTEHNNGVLVYLCLADRAVEIVADRGIAKPVAAARWRELSHELSESCRQGRYEAGAVRAVGAVGALLQEHFPLAPGQTRLNELPDRPLAI
jgi:hypothetical protein